MATTTGASATIDSDRPPPLPLDAIPIIDLSLLSQSELLSLSMCSSSSFDLNRSDDVVIPKIDRSVFNESAGSRKQTYSRLRLAPAQSPTSTNSTIHRRTPRVRSAHTPINNINDAEQAENSQIIRMLKELFKSDHNFGELVPIEVPIEVETDTNVAVSELSNPETKRKRGRPRKDENAVFVNPPAAKRICNNIVKKVIAYNDEADRELVNSRGEKVNLEKLARLQDPYGLEIRRRTEGMWTKDDLLGLLSGLNGEWGTSRKKKKVVDASVFGDFLPKGWKLTLSIKKKLDRFWLICRRYISPGGRPFESCKEVSMYLCSISEEMNKPDVIVHKEDTRRNKPIVLALSASSSQINNSYDIPSKQASVNAKVIVQEDITRKRPVVLALSSSLVTDPTKQVKPNIVGPILKADLLDHQVLTPHKAETSLQFSSENSEWIVVKDDIFECELCNKTFTERNLYNEHIGTHGTNETAEKIVEKVVMETDDATFGDKLLSFSPQIDHKINCDGDVLVEELGEDLEKKCNEDDNESHESDKALDVSVSDSKSGFHLDDETSMSVDESNEKFETFVDEKCNKELEGTNGIVEKDTVFMSNNEDTVMETEVTHADENKKCILEKESSGNSPLLPCTNKEFTETVEKNTVGESVSIEVVNFADDSEIRAESSSKIYEEKGFQENINDTQIIDDGFISEEEKLFNEDCMAEVNKLFDSESPSLVSTEKQDSPQNESFHEENRFSYGITNSRVDGQQEFNNTEFDICNKDNVPIENDVINNQPSNRSTEVNLDDFQIFRDNEFCPPVVVPPENEQTFTFQDDDVSGLYSERGLFDQFSVNDIDLFGDTKFDESTSIGMHDLNLAFGNENTINMDHKKDNYEGVSNQQQNGVFDGSNQQQNGVFDGSYNDNDGFNLNGFGGNFWGGKNVITTSVCAWCRNEFHVQNEIQGGVASYCPSCSAGMSGQVNML